MKEREREGEGIKRRSGGKKSVRSMERSGREGGWHGYQGEGEGGDEVCVEEG